MTGNGQGCFRQDDFLGSPSHPTGSCLACYHHSGLVEGCTNQGSTLKGAVVLFRCDFHNSQVIGTQF